mmetsp:Transcript_6826/g.16248  ORF Transcript_6826/g.16248 Transcript_6826/m.16248 type:complete len:264 (-) Transcript_6826:6-797(-)
MYATFSLGTISPPNSKLAADARLSSSSPSRLPKSMLSSSSSLGSLTCFPAARSLSRPVFSVTSRYSWPAMLLMSWIFFLLLSSPNFVSLMTDWMASILALFRDLVSSGDRSAAFFFAAALLGFFAGGGPLAVGATGSFPFAMSPSILILSSTSNDSSVLILLMVWIFSLLSPSSMLVFLMTAWVATILALLSALVCSGERSAAAFFPAPAAGFEDVFGVGAGAGAGAGAFFFGRGSFPAAISLSIDIFSSTSKESSVAILLTD